MLISLIFMLIMCLPIFSVGCQNEVVAKAETKQNIIATNINTKINSSDIVEITQTGFEETEDAAKTEALLNAVQGAAPTFIEAFHELENNVLVKHVIRQNVKGYINSFDILESRKVPDGYKVTVRAKISKTLVKCDLDVMRSLQDAMGNPKIVVTIKENFTFNETKENTFVLQTEIMSQLNKLGFAIVDYDRLLENENNKLYSLDNESLKKNKDLYRKVGKQYNSPFFLIIGNANLSEQKSMLDGGFNTYVVDLTLKVINPQTAEVLDTFVIKGNRKPDINPQAAATELLIAIANKAVKDNLDQHLKSKWQDYFTNGIPLLIQIKDVRNYNTAANIFNCLKEISGVKSASPEDWNNTTNELEVHLRYRGKSNDFADNIKCGLNIDHVHKLRIGATNLGR